jgi:SAM-dependent methyltransferase
MAIYYRKYDTYGQYLYHQSRKTVEGIYGPDPHERLKQENFRRYKNNFIRQFHKGTPLCLMLNENDRILVPAARIGVEVAALRQMGYPKTIGIDINIGPWQRRSNPLCIVSDFNKTPFPDKLFDAVVFNSIDHCYDIAIFVSEMHRILVDDGIMILDIPHIYRNDQLMSKDLKLHVVSVPLPLSGGKYESCLYDTVEDVKQALVGFSWQLDFRRSDDLVTVALCKKISKQ